MHLRLSPFVLLSAALLAACATTSPKAPAASSADASGAQQATANDGSAVVDKAYQFQLRRPSSDWVLQDKTQIQRLAPVARAGALNMSGFFGAIVVEQVGAMELQSYAKLLVDNMSVADKKLVSMEKVRFLDRDAVRFLLRGTIEGMRVHYEDVVFIHQGFGYQLLGWTEQQRADANKEWFKPFREAFSLLPGKVTGDEEAPPAAVADQVGPGWRIQGGAFESAAYGFRVTPPGRWRLVVGQELRKMNSNAELGFEHVGPDMYGLVLGERTPKTKRSEYLSALERESVEGMQLTRAAGDVHARIGGNDVTFRRYKGATARPVDMLYGIHCQAEHCFQLMAWRLGSLSEADVEGIKQLLGSVKFLDAGARKKLTAELEREPDPLTAIGADWSYRNGRYQDYAHGLTWKKPAGMWRVYTGDAARELGETVDLYLSEPVRGIYGLLMRDETTAKDAAAHHEAIAQVVLKNAERLPPKKRGDFLVSEASVASDTGFLRYRVGTRMVGKDAWRLVFWGRPLDMIDGAKALDAAFGGFQFAAPKMEEASGDKRIDRRMGFAYAPPDAGWKFQDVTPNELKSRGTMMAYRKEPEGVIVLAVHAQGISDPDWFPQFASQMFEKRLRRKADAPPTRRDTTLAGRKAEHLSFMDGASTADVFLTRDGATFYAVFVSSEKATNAARLKQLAGGFEFLEH